MNRRIYVASSWRNQSQPSVVSALREDGHEVYDFRNTEGFGWSQIDPEWRDWSIDEYINLIQHHTFAQESFRLDKHALDWCDTCVLLLPSGKSAHLEAGYACGQGKDVIVFLSQEEEFEPELMYLLASGFVTNMRELRKKCHSYLCLQFKEER